MKPFVLDSNHTNMSGVFYPKGRVFAMFASAQAAQHAAAQWEAQHAGAECAHASPDTILRDIVRTLGSSDIPLPSVGADGDIVRRIADLAEAGCHGLLMDVGKHENGDTLGPALEALGAQAAFYYRTFIIEDLVPQPPTTAHQSVTVGTHAAAPQPDERAHPHTPPR